MDRRNLGRFVWVVLAAVLAASSPLIADDAEGATAITASLPRSDFDGDGRTDLLWRNSGADGMNGLWFMNGASVASTGLLPTVAGPFEANGWSVDAHGDFNADGRADVLWRGANGEMAVWLLNGTTLAGGALLPTVASPWTVVGVGNFDAALGDDIFWRNTTTGENAIWFMNGTAIASGALVTTLATTWTPYLGDFNADGACDLFWRNGTTGENAIWEMAGATLVSGYLLPTKTGSVLLATGDLDADGRADVLWRQLGSGQLTVWLMNGGAVASEATVDADGPPWVVNGLGDLDADGRADIVWRNLETGELEGWFMNGAAVSGTGTLPWAAPGDSWSLTVPRSTESLDPRPSAPAAPTLVSPTGAATSPLPTYKWNAVSDAVWYWLNVSDGSPTPLVDKWYDASKVCSGSTCSVMPGTALAAGSYSWMARAVSQRGFGLWGEKLNFTAPTPAGAAATLVSPGSATGGVSSTSLFPTYNWTGVTDATYYYFYVATSADPSTPLFSNWYITGSVCSGTACAVTPSGAQLNLVDGTEYIWWVQTYFAAGYGAVSTPFLFTAASGAVPGETTLMEPLDGKVLAVITPTFRWSKVAEATWYQIEVMKGADTVLRQWITTEQACESSDCKYNPVVQGGDQTWRVQTYNSNGYGPWTNWRSFTNNLPLRSFVLTWQAEPRDLDSHTLTPPIGDPPQGPQVYHVYYGDPGDKEHLPFVYLDVDDTSGWGPETTSVHVLYPGTYKFYIHLFSGSGSLMGSQATVNSYDADANITHTVVVPNSGSTTARYWYVADVDGASGAVTIKNILMESAPTAATGASVVTSLPPKTPENGPRR